MCYNDIVTDPSELIHVNNMVSSFPKFWCSCSMIPCITLELSKSFSAPCPVLFSYCSTGVGLSLPQKDKLRTLNVRKNHEIGSLQHRDGQGLYETTTILYLLSLYVNNKRKGDLLWVLFSKFSVCVHCRHCASGHRKHLWIRHSFYMNMYISLKFHMWKQSAGQTSGLKFSPEVQ